MTQPYPQQPYPPHGYPPPTPPKRRRRWPWVLLGAAILMTVGFVGCVAALNSAAETLDEISGEHPEDVTVTACERDAVLGWPKATISITNPTDKPTSYAVTISFQSQDGTTQYGEGIAAVTRLAPGQQTTQTAQGTADIPADAAITCVVSSASRTQAL